MPYSCCRTGVLLLVSLAPLALCAEAPAEKGKYLVEEVAKCGDCHTPMAEGKPDVSRTLKGAVLPFQPVAPIPGWHKTAPDLTPSGRLFAKWGAEGLVKFLETGVGPSGRPPAPPMPAYKLKHSDAEAIVAYLQSLK